MNFLIDTHCLIWSLFDPDKLRPSHRRILIDAASTKYVSKVTYWEIALKYALGKLSLKGTTPERLLATAADAGYEVLDISEDDLVTSYHLPESTRHRDPFDRLLVWQSIRNDMTFISSDAKIREYIKHGLKLAQSK